MNRKELDHKVGDAITGLLKTKAYISYVDLFIAMGRLTPQDHEAWRQGRVPYLEKVVRLNLSQISFAMKSVRKNSLNGGLKPSWTAYMSWGKGPQRVLHFSKSGDPQIERLWATHLVKQPGRMPEPACRGDSGERAPLVHKMKS